MNFSGECIDVFIASSIKEFHFQRIDLCYHIYHHSFSQFESRNFRFVPVICENFSDSLAEKDKQEIINREITHCELCYILVGKRLGPDTYREYKCAKETYDKKGFPEVYVYFVEPRENQDESVERFRNELQRDGQHTKDATFEEIKSLMLSEFERWITRREKELRLQNSIQSIKSHIDELKSQNPTLYQTRICEEYSKIFQMLKQLTEIHPKEFYGEAYCLYEYILFLSQQNLVQDAHESVEDWIDNYYSTHKQYAAKREIVFYQHAEILKLLGQRRRREGAFSKAVQYYDCSLKHFKALNAMTSRYARAEADVKTEYAKYLISEDTSKDIAEKLLEEALATYKRIFRERYKDGAISIETLDYVYHIYADLLASRGNTSRALNLYQEAWEIRHRGIKLDIAEFVLTD